MKINLKLLNLFLASGIGLFSVLFTVAIQAVDLRPEYSFLTKSFTLVRSGSNLIDPNALANYHFTIYVPKTAQQSLKEVTIIQQANRENISFFPEHSQAVLEQTNGQEPIEIQTQLIDQETEGIKVIFNQAIAPGNTVTVLVRAKNPQSGGAYQFGVTAFPQENGKEGLYLGTGQIYFPPARINN